MKIQDCRDFFFLRANSEESEPGWFGACVENVSFGKIGSLFQDICQQSYQTGRLEDAKLLQAAFMEFEHFETTQETLLLVFWSK